MNDNNNKDEDEETLKRKKIRRILLLKTDEELKNISKRHSDIMINSKTIAELNKKYNLYNILLSEKSKIYYNYVKTEEKIVSNNIRQINSDRVINREKKIEKPNKIINNSFEEDSNSPILNFLPKKINLGKKFEIPLTNSKNDNIFENNYNFEKSGTNEDKMNKSTKIEKKSLFKLVDKIVSVKMNEDTEEIIKKNIVRLRKYCNKLRKPKKRIKKLNKLRSQITPKSPKNKDKIDKKGNINRKRMTITDNKFLKRKSLFDNNQDKKQEFKIKRVKSRINTTKDLNIKIKEIKAINEIKEIDTHRGSIKDIIKEKENIKDIIKEKERGKIKRMTSSKVITKMNYINKEKNIEPPPNKRKIRKMQTLTGNFKNQILELNKAKALKFNKNSEINKNDETAPLASKNIKNHLLSSKFERPPKYQFNNNSTIKLIFNKEKEKSRFNPDKSIKNSTKEKKEYIQIYINNRDKNDKHRHSTKKYKKNSVKIYDKCLHFSKKDDNRYERRIINFEPNESDIEKMNILSEFNRKSKI